ncbi:MAG: GspE/PulE family protein [Candidatus Kaelpia aquatica]|nr:GspE/PulE family protein [Candidatus Kaelpia aquatica]
MQEIIPILLEKGLIDQRQIEKAKSLSVQKNKDILEILIEMNSENEKVVFKELSLFYKIPYLELDYIDFGKDTTYMLPEDFARKNNVLPLFKINDWFFVGTLFPIAQAAMTEIRNFTGFNVRPVLLSGSEMNSGIDKVYRSVSSAEKIVQKIGEIGDDMGDSVIQIINLVIAQAVRDRTSDIHIEPEADKLRIRFRIDGVLQEVPSPPKSFEMAMISRIKVMANMDIAESRLPQDGHFKVDVDAKEIDVRVSTLPTINGENVVLRILDTANVLLGLEKLGFDGDSLRLFRKAIAQPYGMILTTGPTGSGKTTTLYSALMELNTIDKHIVTVEDPVEYRLPLIRQVQVNSRAGLNFTSGLRSILRHDPDIIMIGEIRDMDAATIAIQAALTGHLVFSTLHTNDAPSAVTRLQNMGVEPYLISASLIAVMAQRLARQICPQCKVSYKASESIIERFNLRSYNKKISLYKGEGCDYCKGTGYQGRVGLFEVLLLDDELKEMIISGASVVALRSKAQSKGMKSLFEDGITKALRGAITLDEVSRVCEEVVEIKPKKDINLDEDVKVKAGAKRESKIAIEDVENYNKDMKEWIAKKEKKTKRE